MTETPMPDELAAALAASEEAQQGWDEAPPDLQKLYIEHVSAPRSRRVREERAADTAITARLGTLREHLHSGSQSWWHVVVDFLPF